jgi:type II secretion system protein G
MRRSKKGFTLIELLIVVAIIGIIAALLIPNFLDALNKARQKRTMADARNVGTAMFQWVTDQVGAAAAGVAITDYSGADTVAEVEAVLVSTYIQDVPVNDGWKGTYVYRLNTDNPGASRVMFVGSGGRDKSLAGPWTKQAFDPTDYDRDIVWADGDFLSWPQKIT